MWFRCVDIYQNLCSQVGVGVHVCDVCVSDALGSVDDPYCVCIIISRHAGLTVKFIKRQHLHNQSSDFLQTWYEDINIHTKHVSVI